MSPPAVPWRSTVVAGVGKFFEGTAAQMHHNMKMLLEAWQTMQLPYSAVTYPVIEIPCYTMPYYTTL